MKSALAIILSVTLSAPGFSQGGDAPPVNTADLLKALQQLQAINEKGIIARREQAFARVSAAAVSGEKAVALWKEAVKAVQFEGAKKEGTKVREWSDVEGDALNDKLCQNAVRLHLAWMALTLKRSAGAETSTLLPSVIDFVKQAQADEDAAEHFVDQLQKAKERDNKSPGSRRVVQEDSIVRRVHDQVTRQSVADSPVARWMQIEEIIGMAGGVRSKKPNPPPTSWENTPGNIGGIYNAIILPEFRAAKDPRLMDYWDVVLKKETDKMADRTLDVEQREWATERRPSLLWLRSQDVMLLGYKNKAIGEMFNIVKTYPNHPNAASWIEYLKGLLSLGEVTATPAAIGTPATPGSVTPPTPIPSATILPPGTPVPAQ